MLGAEGTQEHVPDLGVPADDVERVAALRHGTLTEHLAGNDERGPAFLHDFTRFAHHEDFAVDAGVHDLAETVRRAFTQHPDEVLAHVHGFDFKAVDFFPIGDAARLAEKGRDEVQATDDEPLLHDQSCGEDAVQAAGEEGESVRCGIHRCYSTARKTRTQVFAFPRVPKAPETPRRPAPLGSVLTKPLAAKPLPNGRVIRKKGLSTERGSAFAVLFLPFGKNRLFAHGILMRAEVAPSAHKKKRGWYPLFSILA